VTDWTMLTAIGTLALAGATVAVILSNWWLARRSERLSATRERMRLLAGLAHEIARNRCKAEGLRPLEGRPDQSTVVPMFESRAWQESTLRWGSLGVDEALGDGLVEFYLLVDMANVALRVRESLALASSWTSLSSGLVSTVTTTLSTCAHKISSTGAELEARLQTMVDATGKT